MAKGDDKWGKITPNEYKRDYERRESCSTALMIFIVIMIIIAIFLLGFWVAKSMGMP